ncbi:MAG: histidine kinase [Bdellovibrionota bacterium]
MEISSDIDISRYLKKAALSWDESKPSDVKHGLVNIDKIDANCIRLHDKLSEIIKSALKLKKLEDCNQDLYSYCVPEISEDGVCSHPDKLAAKPYSFHTVLGEPSLDKLKQLTILDDFIAFCYEDLGTDWLGIYKRFNKIEAPTLVKMAYRGIPSRAEFPITNEFAAHSNNSTVALTGKAIVINNLDVHLSKGGVFYVCDEAIRSEACLPIYSPDFSKVVGIIDAESTQTYAYREKELSYLVALCLVLSEII